MVKNSYLHLAKREHPLVQLDLRPGCQEGFSLGVSVHDLENILLLEEMLGLVENDRSYEWYEPCRL